MGLKPWPGLVVLDTPDSGRGSDCGLGEGNPVLPGETAWKPWRKSTVENGHGPEVLGRVGAVNRLGQRTEWQARAHPPER